MYRKTLLLVASLGLTVLALGTIGFTLLEGTSPLESLYWTVVTLATVGYGDFVPHTSGGRVFAIILIISGFGVLAYGAGSITTFIVEGHLISVLRRRKMDRQIADLQGHVIVCGAGYTGRHVIEELHKTKTDYVLIDMDKTRIEKIPAFEGTHKLLYVLGDATEDECLIQAGIMKARGLIAVLANDKDNLFVVVAARSLNPNLRIVAKAVATEAKNKILKAGADSVVSPEAIGGLRMASEMLRPAVVTFLDTMLRSGKGDLRVEEAPVSGSSELVGKSLEEAQISERTGTIVVALKAAREEKFIYNPPKHRTIESGDILIAMGDVEQVKKLRAVAGSLRNH